MEYWNNGFKGISDPQKIISSASLTIIPPFHHSILALYKASVARNGNISKS
jgi:hypothetical protein